MFSKGLYWLAFSSALLYTIGILFLKQSMARGCGVWQVNFFSNLCMVALIQPLWFLAQPSLLAQHWMLPVCAGLTFLFGQLFSFLALFHGDVSVAVPLQGVKILAVAFILSFFFGSPISPEWWWAAALSSLGIILVTGSQSIAKAQLHAPLTTAAYALSAAGFFALTDIVLLFASQKVGVVNTITTQSAVIGLCTLLIYPLLLGKKKIWPSSQPPGAFKWLFWGALILGAQYFGIVLCICYSGDATASNILYSSRCIWSVVLAWMTAHYLGSMESKLKTSTMLLRTVGALLLFAAILMVLL